MRILLIISSLLFLTGCGSVTSVQFYQPTQNNTVYCSPTADGKFGHGPVKKVQGKKGLSGMTLDHLADFSVSVF